MEQVKIRSGTRVKFKHIHEDGLPPDFLSKLREFSHKNTKIQAVYLFSIQADEQQEQMSMAIAVKKPVLGRGEDDFLRVVDEIQLMLPSDLAVNLYRFGESEALTRYCLKNLEPIYLRSTAWQERQQKKFQE
ncbi:MAG: enhanced serine sensitivity protein SseB [bacterium]|nr:enhanced serine sensitivity protein SseB [bacterium]